MNNITVVVIFIPIIQALAVRFNQPASKLLIALNYAAVLGGRQQLLCRQQAYWLIVHWLKWVKRGSDFSILLYWELLWRPLGWYMSYSSPLNSCRIGAARFRGLGLLAGGNLSPIWLCQKIHPWLIKLPSVDYFLVYRIKYYEWLSVTTRQFFHHSKIIRHKLVMCWWMLRCEKLWSKP